MNHIANLPCRVAVRFNPCPAELTLVRITLVNGPVLEGLAARKHGQVGSPRSSGDEGFELRPECVHMRPVTPFDRLLLGLEHRLQAAFGAQPVEVIGIGPAWLPEEPFRVLLVAVVRICEIIGMGHGWGFRRRGVFIRTRNGWLNRFVAIPSDRGKTDG